MSWERNKWGACLCHGKSFCPDYTCVGYDEQDVPIYVKNEDVDLWLGRKPVPPLEYHI